MKSYRVVLEGAPLTIEIDGQLQRVGFVVTRFVEAADQAAARAEAIRRVRSDPKLIRSSEAAETASLTVSVDRVEPISKDRVPAVQPGFAFFSLDEEMH